MLSDPEIFRQTAAEEMMNTLPDEWKKSPMRSNGRRGGVNNKFGNQKKRPASATTQQPVEKKKKESDGKIVITADNPVSCLYEYAKKVRLNRQSYCSLKFEIVFRKKYLTRILIAFRKIY